MTDESGIANSRIENLKAGSPEERLHRIARAAGITISELDPLRGENTLPLSLADGMVENVVGKFELPLCIATNFTVNGNDYLVPMVVEEPSVVAAASYMARIVRENGGFKAESSDPVMRAQIQILRLADLAVAAARIESEKAAILEKVNEVDSILVGLGGGCMDIEVHSFPDTIAGPMLVAHLLVDVRDAMGANAVNSMAEAIAPLLEKVTGGEVRLRILSNLADKRTVKATAKISRDTLATADYSGAEVAQRIVEAYALAAVDPYRAATHNKGIMNGIDPVVIATGNDWRAIEAGAHAWAARSGHYTSLTVWRLDQEGNLNGTIELPMALGLVGGATKTHPAAQTCLRLLNVQSASELGEVIASVGLAQNLAALRALATEGIQRGHMALHAKNLAIAAGARGKEIELVATALVECGEVSAEKAATLLKQVR